MTDEKALAMRRVQICLFALNEAALFLDGHPSDAAGLAYFNKYKLLLNKARGEYEASYGPLTQLSAAGEGWKWIEQPWPWQL